jgi:energy-coupling factor transport system permease protein
MSVPEDRRWPAHNLDPRVKIAWSAVVSLLAVILRHPLWLAALLAVAVAPWGLVRRPLVRLRLLLVVVGTTVIGSMLSQGLFYGSAPRTEWLTLLPGLSLCKEGIVYGAVVSLRLLSAMAAGALVVFTTPPSDLVLALRKLRVPEPLAFTLTLALRFLPEIIERGKGILAAQQPQQGGGTGFGAAVRRFRHLLIPLLAVSLRSARQAALAAEIQTRCSAGVQSRDLRLTAADWVAMAGLALLAAAGVAAALLGYDTPWGKDPASQTWPCFGAALGLLAAVGVALALGARKRPFRPFTPLELETAAVLICLLRIAIVPWQIGLAKLPGLNALIFAVPYTVIFLSGLRLAPRPGFATLLIVGQGLFGQLLGGGINPVWWPYYLWCAFGVEALLLWTGHRMRNLPVMLAAGMFRGLLAGSYTYLIAAPFIWHKFYAPWYIAMMILTDLLGCAIGAAIAWRLAPTVERAARPSGL